MKSKVVNVVLNILIVLAGIAFIVCFSFMLTSFKEKNEKKEDPAESYNMVFEYELRHKAYHEIMDSVYALRMKNYEPEKGFENMYNVAEYAHTVFMARIYEAQGNAGKIDLNRSRMEAVKGKLGDYAYTAEDVEAMVDTAASSR